MDKYNIRREIGSGNFAKVYLATDVFTKQEVAIKLVTKKELANAKACARVRAEMANIKKLSGHKNIVSLIETFETRKHFGIVMEYVPGGELFEFVKSEEGMTEVSAREMFRGILQGVKHCHDNGISHRDIKLENILLDKNNTPKIADFGFSREMASSESFIASSVGSLLYSSPEIIERKPYKGTECDIWSLGVVLYIMLTASMPFDDRNLGDFLVKISSGTYPEPVGVSDAARDLISRMITVDQETRYTMKEVLLHPWVSANTTRKNSSTLSSKFSTRRNGVCYQSADAIRYALLKLNQCDCGCHKSDSTTSINDNHDSSHDNSRDSVVSRHCLDCDDIQANDPDAMLRRQVRLSRNSSRSSGYGSEAGSQTLPTPDDEKLLGCKTSQILGRRSSVPRKSSVGTVHTRSSHQRCSVPSRPHVLKEYADEGEIVFV